MWSDLRSRLAAALAATLVAVPAAALAVPQVGKPAPALTLPSLDGKTVSLARLRGRPVYLNFFATWCGPCNEEAPWIGALRKKYAPRGLQVVGVDELDPPGGAAKFVKQHGAPYGLVGIDDAGSVGRSFGTIAMPVHVFIDKGGIVRGFRIGEMSAAEIESGIRAIL